MHVLVTGHEGERNRRIELVEAPRFGIVGKDQTIVARIVDTDDQGEPATLTVRRDGETIATLTPKSARLQSRRRSTTPAPMSSNSKSRR